jgi:hypothetical protein
VIQTVPRSLSCGGIKRSFYFTKALTGPVYRRPDRTAAPPPQASRFGTRIIQK